MCFEEIAAKILIEKPELKLALENKRLADPEFAKSQWAQLFFVYKHSVYYEPNVGVLPIYLIY